MEITNAKNRFAQSLKELLINKPIKQITVSELTENAGLSRQTFYQLFEDKYDLVAYVWAVETEKSMRTRDKNVSLKEHWIHHLQSIEADKITYKRLLEYIDDQNSFFYRWIELSVASTGIMNKMLKSSPDLAFAAKLFSYGSAMCVRDWVMGGCKKSPEDLAQQIVFSIPSVLMPHIVSGYTDSGNT